MDWIIVVVLIVLLLASIGPRAGFYGAASAVWDILSLILLVILVVWLLRLFGVLVF